MLRRLSAFFSALCVACSVHAGALWFADSQGVHRVETDTNAVTTNIAQAGVLALTLDQKDGSLWALTGGNLFKYDANGATLLALDLKSLSGNFNAARRLALDPGDDSIWVAGGGNAFHLDAAGHVLASVTSNDVVQDIALTQDETIWILGRNTLARYSPQGALIASASLTADMQQSIQQSLQQAIVLVADDANGVLWLAGSKNVFQIAIALPIQTRLALTTSEVVSGIALDAGTGNLWVAGQTSLFGFAKDGASLAANNLAQRNLGNFQALDFDAQSQSLWLGHEKGVSRFTSAGQYVATLPASVKVVAISAAPSGIVPIVTLVSPPDGTLTRNAFIPIRLHYDASCFGQPCNFPASVLAAYTLSATLNGQSIGGAFVFDAATHDAVFTPALRDPEGVNAFSAFVTDSSGRRSRTISSQFTVDSVAPRFVNVTPADGSTFTSPNVTLQGSIDEIAVQVLLESFSGTTFSGANPQGQFFGYGLTLRPGTNALRLTATDAAGNSTPLSLTYVFASLTITITNPTNGATIDDSKVTVTGTFSGATSATITVNGLPATVVGNAFSAVDVPLHSGSNTITVSGTSPQGAHDTQSITVISSAPAITIASPANGATINGDSVLVRGSIQAPANSGVSINGVVAALDGANNFFAVVPLQPGSNTLNAKVTSPRGSSASQSVTVSASGVPPTIVATAAPVTGMAPLTVTFTVTNPTAGNATYFFDTFGPFSVPANGSSSISLTYPEGVFTPAIVVNGGGPQPFVITVTSVASMDAMLQALWRNIAGNLAAGNIEGALTFFAPGMRDSYRQVLTDIAPSLPAMFASFPPIKPTNMVDGDAEYFVPIVRSGKTYGYFLYFMRDGDGIWRLHSL